MQLETSISALNRRLNISSIKPDSGSWSDYLRQIAGDHSCAKHPLFEELKQCPPSGKRIAAFLRNYDAHAAVLRRLLLKAVTIMPEEACGYILENIRNEYGNGDPANRHELQLKDLAFRAGVSAEEFKNAKISTGTRSFIAQALSLYYPLKQNLPVKYCRPAIAAGAITATELLAIKEFVHMQYLFEKLALGNHIWFKHIDTEVDHFDDSLSLALYFIEQKNAADDVLLGLMGILAANIALYDGLLEALA